MDLTVSRVDCIFIFRLGLGSGGAAAYSLVDLIDDSIEQIKQSYQADGLRTFGDYYIHQINKRSLTRVTLMGNPLTFN